MHVVHIRPQGNQIQTGDLFRKQATFQTCMDRNHLGFHAEFFHPGIFEDTQQFRIGIELPAGVIIDTNHLGTAKAAQYFNLFTDRIFSAFHRAAHCVIDIDMVFICFQNTDIAGAFHQTFHIGIHCLHAIRQQLQHSDQVVSCFCCQRFGNFFHSLHRHKYIAFAVFIFIPENFLQFHHNSGCFEFLRRIDGDDCFRFTADGVVHIAAVSSYQCIVQLFTQLQQESAQQDVCAGSLQVNICAGMAALQTTNMDRKCLCICFLCFPFQR